MLPTPAAPGWLAASVTGEPAGCDAGYVANANSWKAHIVGPVRVSTRRR